MRAIACFLTLLLGFLVAALGSLGGIMLDIRMNGTDPSLMGFGIAILSVGAGIVIINKAMDIW